MKNGKSYRIDEQSKGACTVYFGGSSIGKTKSLADALTLVRSHSGSEVSKMT